MPADPFAPDLPASSWLHSIARRFEDAWQAGAPPNLEDFLPADPARRQKALIELACLDLQQRLRQGEAVRVENYLARFPELAHDARAVLELIKSEHAQRQGLALAEYLQRFLQPAAIETGPDSVAGGDNQVPVRLGRYRVDKLLGKGGFGVVYQGYDEELERAVAIKVPRRDRLTRPGDAEAYMAEARVVARLEHPHIVPVLDVGRSDDGLCFVVSRFVAGSTLAQQIAAGRAATSAAAGLVATVAEALHYAHTGCLVHRDVKPGNILLDQAGTPYLADFGLALREQDYGKGGGICGTPAYMSPEQANGEGHRVDGRSDIFSLGVVFYELLTGRRPFQGDTTAILEQIVATEPRPPRQLDDTLPRELERICLKAMAKRASERYTTARDMAEDLRHWITGMSVGREPKQTQPITPEQELAAAPSVGKDVFLSYASPDQDAAFRLCLLLEDRGVACWIAPRDVTAGADYAEAIIRAIEGTATTILLLSAHSNASVHVTHEVERATSKRKRVIPVRLAEVKPGPALEFHLATAQWLDAWRTSLEQVAAQLILVLRGAIQSPSPAAIPPSTPSSDRQMPRIVPKGLRSFDSQDADFFLELLPGPRDRDGLPDSVRFWKMRIEEPDPENTFAVGLIYGPSGCGKSSLVKAGLLPRLSDKVLTVYVEATAGETETRLLNALRKRCPGLPDKLGREGEAGEAPAEPRGAAAPAPGANLGLKEALAALRRGQGIPPGKKVLIVLDQFEQWLHAKKEEDNTELVQALRQCDGGRIQCVVMVRDDFWMAVMRFLSQLEIELEPGRNVAAVDLFPIRHAEKVLSAFGRAFTALPADGAAMSREQQQFVEQAIQGLAQEKKVISVRLALFAEMMKGRPWTPAVLKEVGGAQGVGVTFLEETFSSPQANPKHRLHQKAARAVLKALLPESGSDIKGHMRSHGDLLAASGYASRPKDFADLLRILDSEIRLITPTDPEGAEGEPGALATGGNRQAPPLAPVANAPGSPTPVADAPAAPAKYYQLTHDYLVHSLRDWLTRKQKETRRGRAELLLADRAAVWNARPENRQLPSLLQWLNLQVLTRKQNWTPPQRKMMRRAMRFHLLRGLMFTALLAGVVLLGWDALGRLEAHNLRGRLLGVKTAEVPDVIKAMVPYRRWTEPLLRAAYTQAQEQGDAAKQLHASLALLPMDPSQVRYLNGRLLQGEPDEVVVIRAALAEHKQDLVAEWWALLKNQASNQEQRFRAAAALARHDADNPLWETFSPDVAAKLVAQKPFEIAKWTAAFKPVAKSLLPPLAELIAADKGTGSEIAVLAGVYGSLAVEVPEAVTRLEERLTEQPKADPEYKIAKQQVNVAVALLVMGRGEKVWPLLKHSSDPTQRSFLMERLGPGGVDANLLLSRLAEKQDVSIRRAILLSLGEFVDRLSELERRNLVPPLEGLYRDDPDAGIHGATEWVLRRWLKEDEFKKLEKSLLRGPFEFKGKDWCVTKEGHTMVFVRKPEGEVAVGDPDQEGKQRKERIASDYAIAAKEVTVGQFLRFRKDHPRRSTQFYPSDVHPMMEVSWFDGAAYCNWLSKEEGIAKEQWCYEETKKGEYKAAANHLQRSGYRLATEAEWEYACRTGSAKAYGFGEPDELLGKFAWFSGNSVSKSHPVGQLKPNDFGLFDMHGNAWEWCDDVYGPGVGGASPRVVRGGCWSGVAAFCRAAYRGASVPAARYHYLGLRLARVSVGSKSR